MARRRKPRIGFKVRVFWSDVKIALTIGFILGFILGGMVVSYHG